MAKTTRALSGAQKDAFFARVVEGEHLDVEAGARLAGRLQRAVTQVRVRTDDDAMRAAPSPPPGHSEAEEPPFDPFSPNVIVVLRTAGREAALQELAKVRGLDRLRLLAREQQLSIGGDALSEDAVREAIVSAAERRVANRRAAASAG